MSDTAAIAAISGGSAVLGAAIGAGAAHWTTIRSQKLQSAEERRRNRIEIYQELLASVHEFMQAAGGIESKSADEWADWFRDYERKHSAVLLLGTKQVRRAALSIFNEIGNVLAEATKMTSTSGDPHTAYLKRESQVMQAYDDAVEAMRSDVGVRQ